MNHRRRVAALVGITALLTGLMGTLESRLLPSRLNLGLNLSRPALSRSSGGRSKGGSFSRPSSPSRSTSSPSRSTSPTRSNGGPVIIPVPIQPQYNSPYRRNDPYPTYQNPSYQNPTYRSPTSASSNDGGVVIAIFVVLLVIVLGGVALIGWLIFRAVTAGMRSGGGTPMAVGGDRELTNDTVTVSKLQVALLAEARDIQRKLTHLTENANTETAEGLVQLLQESALSLLRTPENWSHVAVSSLAMHRDQAEAMFNNLSVKERSKFSAETLANVGGRVNRQEIVAPGAEEGTAAYIVVTLLIGTEHDKPLFKEIRSTEALQQALEQVAAIPANYLLIFELLWSPQTENDSLTYDELLTEYSDMVQI